MHTEPITDISIASHILSVLMDDYCAPNCQVAVCYDDLQLFEEKG